MEVNVNVDNIGIVGASGEGKSYYFENTVLPMLNKSILIIDPKDQYKNIEKPGYKKYLMKEPEDPVKAYRDIIKKIRFDYKKAKFKVLIIWFPEDISSKEKFEPKFNKILKHWSELGNNTTILEEAHDFRRSRINAFGELEQTMRKRTGEHNKNSNVIWLTQLPQDMPRAIYSNTNALIVFSQWDNIYQVLVTNRVIPDSVENPESHSYKYQIISR